MNFIRPRALGFLLLFMLATPSVAERDLSIDAVYLNGQTSREIRVRPGELISGRVQVFLRSSSLLREHSAIWLPSWENSRHSVRVFYESLGGSENISVPIDVYAPSYPGVHYILFCFDRRPSYEMYDELNLRSYDQIYANGRAVRVVVESNSLLSQMLPSSLGAPFPNAGSLDVNGLDRPGVAGSGGGESIWRLVTNNLSSDRDDAVRVRVAGDRPNVDIDLEIVDQYGLRRGLSEREGSFGEESVVRVRPGDVLYAKVYGYKRNQDAPYRIVADRVSLAGWRRDPSFGRYTMIHDGYAARGRAGYDMVNPRWYAFTLPSDGSYDITVTGDEPHRNLDLFVYDDLGNLRGTSQSAGSRLERFSTAYTEAGIYYIKVAAVNPADESDFSIQVRVTPGSSQYATNAAYPGDGRGVLINPGGNSGVELDLGGVRIRF